MTGVHLSLCMGEVEITTNNLEYISTNHLLEFRMSSYATITNTLFSTMWSSELPTEFLKNAYIQVSFLEVIIQKLRTSSYTLKVSYS